LATCALASGGFSPFGEKGFLVDEFSPQRRRLPNPYMENGKPIVVVVRGKDFKAMLAKGMELLGGFARFGSDKTVHLKPNFIAPSLYPVTTDGESLLATVELLKKEGFGDIAIAEWGSMGARGARIPTIAFTRYKCWRRRRRADSNAWICGKRRSSESGTSAGRRCPP
jgi:hypothetical protein